jgi:outer membrane protein assembly factor BamD (BamD/ComL family)
MKFFAFLGICLSSCILCGCIPPSTNDRKPILSNEEIYELAMISYTNYNYPLAERQFLTVLDRDWNMTKAHIGLGYNYYMIGLVEKVKRNPDEIARNFNNALYHFLEASIQEPKNPEPYVGMAQVYLSGAKYDDAIKYFEKAMERSPGQPTQARISFYNGLAQAKVGKYKEAIAELKRYLELVQNAPNKRGVEDVISDMEKLLNEQNLNTK